MKKLSTIKVPHRGLIKKLYHFVYLYLVYLVNGLSIFKRQAIKSNSKFSRNSVQSGIPEGSVLVPLLFIMYVNDLPDICTNDTVSICR